MERNGDEVITENKPQQEMQMDGEGLVLNSNLFLDYVGEVLLTLNSDGLSWKLIEAMDADRNESSCFGIKLSSKFETEIKISDIYAVEFINWGLIHESALPNTGGCLLGRDSEMYRFMVHGYRRSKTRRSQWILAAYTFGHKNLQTCQTWVDQINAFINMELGRPKNLLVFVHPLSGKGNGCRIWETAAPIFSLAKVKTKVIVTQRSGHASDVMASITDRELSSYDGVVAVGGDGFFNEILNGLLRSRLKAPYPPSPTEVTHSTGNTCPVSVHDPNEAAPETSRQNEDENPLLHSSIPNEKCFSNLRAEGGSCNADQDPIFPLPNERFRLGIIPAGSTDAIVICTTGARDPVTSALHIVLGRRVYLDIAQIIRWKMTKVSNHAPFVHYAASFAGYGFYGDVIKESENYRWMGPKRYDYAGTKVFLRHRSYEAEIAYLEVETETVDPTAKKGLPDSGTRPLGNPPTKPERVICRVNCSVCNQCEKPSVAHYAKHEKSRWLRSKGRFLSVGAAVISCRNEKAPDGLVADAHLADGFLHLILIKDCPRSFYLWHLTQLARKGGNPLNFQFVEHYKTPAFTFTSSGDDGVWNLDGELIQAHQLSAQVFRGLVGLFASGPEI